MTAAASLQALIPRPQNAFVHDGFESHEQPAIRELQALANIDVALHPEQMDGVALDNSVRFLDARSHSDDLRLPPPPRQASNGVALYRSMASSVAKFQERKQQAVIVDPKSIAAEARLMAACHGICRFQDQIFGARQRPTDALAQRVVGRSF